MCNLAPETQLPVEIRLVSPMQLQFLLQVDTPHDPKNFIKDLRVE